MEQHYGEIANYRNLSPERLILMLNEIDDKITKLNQCQYTDRMLDMIYDYRANIESLIEEYISTGKINDSVYFEVDEYFRKKYELQNYTDEAMKTVETKFLTNQISESEMILEIERIKENHERELDVFNKSLK